MGHQVKTIYKEADAYYDISGAAQARVVTLLHYTGQPHNRPPARIIVTHAAAAGTFTNDVCAAMASTQPPAPAADPLFPDKQEPRVFLDFLV